MGHGTRKGFQTLITIIAKHESYDRKKLIAAVQAVTLYTILHVEDVASIPEHYLRSITVTLGVCLCCAAGFMHVHR